MKLLIEFDIGTKKVIGAVPNAISFVELPGTSGSCLVEDEVLSEQIWQSHFNGGQVVVTVDDQWNFISADIEAVELPEPPKTPEEIRIEQLEADNLTLMEAIADLYEMMLSGGAA